MKTIEIIEKKVKKTSGSDPELVVALTRDRSTQEVVIQAKSPALCNFFKLLSGEATKRSGKWGGMYWSFPKGGLPTITGISFSDYGGPLYMKNDFGLEEANLAWFRHTGLDEGMEVRLKNALITKVILDDYYKAIEHAVRELAGDFLQDYDRTLVLLGTED